MDTVTSLTEAISYIDAALNIFQPILLNLYMSAMAHAIFVGVLLRNV